MADARVRQLKIKTGVLRRAVKEKDMYEKEVVTERTRLNKMQAENKDEYVIRKQEEVIAESLMMVPDCQKRIFNAYNDLKALLQETEADLNQKEEYAAAKSTLEEVVLE